MRSVLAPWRDHPDAPILAAAAVTLPLAAGLTLWLLAKCFAGALS